MTQHLIKFNSSKAVFSSRQCSMGKLQRSPGPLSRLWRGDVFSPHSSFPSTHLASRCPLRFKKNDPSNIKGHMSGGQISVNGGRMIQRNADETVGGQTVSKLLTDDARQ